MMPIAHQPGNYNLQSSQELIGINTMRSEQRIKETQSKIHEIFDISSPIESEFSNLTLIDKAIALKKDRDKFGNTNKQLNIKILSLNERLRAESSTPNSKKIGSNNWKKDTAKLSNQVSKLKTEIADQKKKYEKYLEESTLLCTMQIKEMQKKNSWKLMITTLGA